MVGYDGISRALDQDIKLLKWSALAGEYGMCAAWDPEGRLGSHGGKMQHCQRFLCQPCFPASTLRLLPGKRTGFCHS